jgi:hypothetical protein
MPKNAKGLDGDNRSKPGLFASHRYYIRAVISCNSGMCAIVRRVAGGAR